MHHRPRAPSSAAVQTRRRIAIEAARLISESGLRDYRQAREKAAARLGIHDAASLPRNDEIDAALREHQRLFAGPQHAITLRHLREQAREALQFFAAFEPRLVGAVLDGSADAHSAVCVHLHTDQLADVADLLARRGINWSATTRRLRIARDTMREFPALRFEVGDTTIDVTVLPYDALRQAPLNRSSDGPIQRATLAMVEALLGGTQAD